MGNASAAEVGSPDAAPPAAPAAASSWTRRLTAEWALLSDLAKLNPDRVTDLILDDTTMRLCLRATPALLLDGSTADTHPLRIEYPRFFPSMPLELYLDVPVLHPNVHPHTGFVCLWETHRVANTVEHALHKTAAILSWYLMNLDPGQVMQPAAAELAVSSRSKIAHRLSAPLLNGIQLPCPAPATQPEPRRRRLA